MPTSLPLVSISKEVVHTDSNIVVLFVFGLALSVWLVFPPKSGTFSLI